MPPVGRGGSIIIVSSEEVYKRVCAENCFKMATVLKTLDHKSKNVGNTL